MVIIEGQVDRDFPTPSLHAPVRLFTHLARAVIREVRSKPAVICSTFNLIVVRTSHYRAKGDQEHVEVDGVASDVQFVKSKQTGDESSRCLREELSGTIASVATISD